MRRIERVGERERSREREWKAGRRERERKRIIVLFVRELEMNIQVNFELMLNCFYFHCQRLIAQGHIQRTLIKLVTAFFVYFASQYHIKTFKQLYAEVSAWTKCKYFFII